MPSPPSIPFASTARLNIRTQRPSDTDHLLALVNDPTVQRSGPSYVRPRGPKLREALEGQADRADNLFAGILEAKIPMSQLKTPDPSTAPNNPITTGSPPAEDELFVGEITLHHYGPAQTKNRDATFGIDIARPWRGRGLGTEATRWLVDYAFEQLGMHRISLEVMGDNPAAFAVYRKV
jgi:RimJ/RimL family protein N-acetyltransferase